MCTEKVKNSTLNRISNIDDVCYNIMTCVGIIYIVKLQHARFDRFINKKFL